MDGDGNGWFGEDGMGMLKMVSGYRQEMH